MQMEPLTTYSGTQRDGRSIVEEAERCSSADLLGSLIDTYVRRATASASTPPLALVSNCPGNHQPRVGTGDSDGKDAVGRAVLATVRLDRERRITWPSDLRPRHLAFVHVRCTGDRLEIQFTSSGSGVRLDERSRFRLPGGFVALSGITPGERVQVVATPDPTTFLLQAIARRAEDHWR